MAKNLTGLIPHVMETMSTQCERSLKMIRSRQTGVDKYLYLSSLKGENVDLFYRLLIDNAKELMPLVYTPTIGDVCLQYSTLYTRPEALYISIKQRKSIRTILRNWPYPNPEICVVTDGSRILGLGDLGVNGVGIPVSAATSPGSWQRPRHNQNPGEVLKLTCAPPPSTQIGKLSLYTAAAGIHPEKTLPIVLGHRHGQRGQPQGPAVPGPALEAHPRQRAAGAHGRVHGGRHRRVPEHGGPV